MAGNLAELRAAPFPVLFHLATVLPAFGIGTWLIFASRKGAPVHRALGWVYLALMSATAVSTLFIHQSGAGYVFGYGPIHLFVPLTALGVYNAIQGARTHNIRRHAGAMIGLYVGGLVIAGLLTFLPGRLMHRIFFG